MTMVTGDDMTMRHKDGDAAKADGTRRRVASMRGRRAGTAAA